MDLDQIKNGTVRKILEFSIPSIIAMVLSSMITVVDGFFVGNYVGKEGLAAINLGLPVLYFYLALGLMFSVGGIAIAGMALGGGKIEKCKNVFNQTITVSLAASVLLSGLVYLFFAPIMRALQVSEALVGYFESYYGVMLFTYPLLLLNSALGMFIRGEGKPQFVMLINIGNLLCNTALDYLFAGVLGLGIAGVAVASLISVALVTLCSALFFARRAKVYRFGRFRFSGAVMRSMALNGGSEFIGEISMCFSMYAYNWVIMRSVGVDGVAAFSIVGYLAYIFSMVVIGFGQGMSPLVSFTYGARETELAAEIRKKTNLFVFLAGAATALIMLFAADWYGSLFLKNAAVSDMLHSGIRIFVIAFLFEGVNTICSMYFTSIGRAKESAVISASRGFVVLLACIFLLPRFFGMTGVWLAAPVTEAVTILISAFYLCRERRAAREPAGASAPCDHRLIGECSFADKLNAPKRFLKS